MNCQPAASARNPLLTLRAGQKVRASKSIYRFFRNYGDQACLQAAQFETANSPGVFNR